MIRVWKWINRKEVQVTTGVRVKILAFRSIAQLLVTFEDRRLQTFISCNRVRSASHETVVTVGPRMTSLPFDVLFAITPPIIWPELDGLP